ncbi:MAG: GNAT family N-acetyltransferase [Actinomycetales bacterium]|nr:GNAT family N-acetyltransferase [Actinomycetales bacterium]
MNTYLRTCDEGDRKLLHDLRRKSEEWLAAKGVEQYQGVWSARAHTQIDKLLDERRFVALCDGADRTLAVGALVGPDMDFWTEDDDLHTAWYIARLMVNTHGTGAGATLLDGVALAAAMDGRKYLRLDCWRTNIALHGYYETKGFYKVRLVEVSHRKSGALFQRSVRDKCPTPWDAIHE